MNIIDQTFFSNPNYLYIPLAIQDPSGSANNSNELAFLIQKVEKEVLLNSLGLTLYNELQLALNDLENPLNAKWKKLVYGDEYDEKVWNGLAHEESLIACRVFELYNTHNAIRLSATGATVVNAENATNITPMYLIANANQSFIKQYQGNYLKEPIIHDNFTDWFGHNNEVEQSLYSYLIDKLEDFSNFKAENFKVYETVNTFGI